MSEARNLVVSICHSGVRGHVPVASDLGAPPSSALSPSFLTSRPAPRKPPDTLVCSRGISIFEFGGRAAPYGRRPDITRILETPRTSLECDPRIPEVAPKIPRLPAIPFLPARAPIRGIRSFESGNRESLRWGAAHACVRSCTANRSVMLNARAREMGGE